MTNGAMGLFIFANVNYEYLKKIFGYLSRSKNPKGPKTFGQRPKNFLKNLGTAFGT
jgi:hypothetical protein